MAGLAGGGLLTAAGCSSSSNSSTSTSSSTKGPLRTVRYLTGAGIFAQEGNMWAGKQLKYFADEGIDLQILPGPSGTKNMDMVRAGSADIAGLDTVAIMYGYGTGKYTDMTMLAPQHQLTLSCITALASNDISTPGDLKGKTIGNIPFGGPYLIFPAWARVNNLDPGTVKFVPFNVQQIAQLLISHSFDAATSYTVTSAGSIKTAADAAHQQLVNFNYADTLEDLYGNSLVTTKKFAQSNPDLVAAFVRATTKSMQFTLQNTDQVAQMFTNGIKDTNPTYDLATAKIEVATVARYMQGTTPVGKYDQTRVTKMISALESTGLFPVGAFTADEIIDFKTAPHV